MYPKTYILRKKQNKKKPKRTSNSTTSGALSGLFVFGLLTPRSRPMKIQKAFSFLVAAAPITEVYRNMVVVC